MPSVPLDVEPRPRDVSVALPAPAAGNTTESVLPATAASVPVVPSELAASEAPTAAVLSPLLMRPPTPPTKPSAPPTFSIVLLPVTAPITLVATPTSATAVRAAPTKAAVPHASAATTTAETTTDILFSFQFEQFGMGQIFALIVCGECRSNLV